VAILSLSRNSGVGDRGRTGGGKGRGRKKKAVTLKSLSGLISLSRAKAAH